MGVVEIFINKEGVLKVVQRYDLRVLLKRLRPQGFERHRVVKRPNCNCLSKSDRDVKFNRILMLFFLIALTLAVINLIIWEQLLTHGRPPDEASTWDYVFNQTWLFVVLLAVFAAVLAVGVLAQKATRNISSAPARRDEVQTISALVQQV